jgi:hypothetical protein
LQFTLHRFDRHAVADCLGWILRSDISISASSLIMLLLE